MVEVDESGIVRVPPEARSSGLSQLMLVVAEPEDDGGEAAILYQLAEGEFEVIHDL